MTDTTGVEIPAGLLAFKARPAEWHDWLGILPRLVRELLDEWELRPDGEATHGYCALVLPVRGSDGRSCVLKVSWPHDEEEHEHLALQAWHGNGVVRMYRADPGRSAMLLERLHSDRDLTTIDVIEACEIVAGLYPRLHIPALPQLRTLPLYIDRWTTDLAGADRSALLPRRYVDQAISLGRAFCSDPASAGTMIHGDLHYENVLAADREPWLVIDPKPMSGDPHYEVAALLWNRWDEVVATGDVRTAVRSRFHTVIDVAGLDEERARDWVIVRMMHNAMWVVDDAPDGLDDEDRDQLTTCIAIVKAVQD